MSLWQRVELVELFSREVARFWAWWFLGLWAAQVHFDFRDALADISAFLVGGWATWATRGFVGCGQALQRSAGGAPVLAEMVAEFAEGGEEFAVAGDGGQAGAGERLGWELVGQEGGIGFQFGAGFRDADAGGGEGAQGDQPTGDVEGRLSGHGCPSVAGVRVPVRVP